MKRNLTGFFISVFAFAILLIIDLPGLSAAQEKVLAVAALIIGLWVTDAVPMAAAALLPLVLFPLMGIATIEDTAVPYADKIIFLFMGGFLLGLGIEKWNLHRRIALGIVHFTGASGNRVILGFILSTGLLSMWLSNTATTMLMFPIATSVIHVMKRNESGNTKNFAVGIMLAIAYSSNFGGIATIIGTPPNVAYVGHLQKYYGFTFSFSNWLLLCAPLAILLLAVLYLLLTKMLFVNGIKTNAATALLIQQERIALGPMSAAEKRVSVIFGITAMLWITKDLINGLQWFKLDDTMIALMGALSLFIVPSGNATASPFLLQWKDTQKMAWGILILFGGGIALASQLEAAGLIGLLGVKIAEVAGSNLFLLIFFIAVITIFLSEVMSNTAQVIVFAPVVAGMADAMHVNPVLLGLPMALAASCASMLPMGTPPNAIVFASKELELKDMLKAGFVMNIVSVILITLLCYFILPLVLPAVP